jgi:hypothetical protein
MKLYYVPYFTDRKPVYEEAEELLGRCVGPGWLPTLLDLTRKLEHLGWDGGLIQVKEKFGTLRFYWRNNIQEPMTHAIAQDVVDNAEARTRWICEMCGEYGEVKATKSGWLVCLCEGCRARREG